MDFPKPGTAEGLFTQLKTEREFFVNRAEENAAFSIPSVFPRIGHARGTTFVPPASGVAAQGVNNLAAKLGAVILPTTGASFRLVPDRTAREFLGTQDPSVQAEIEASLQEMERDVQLEIETEALRVTVTEMLQHLIITGNALQYQPEKGGLIMYPLSQYVVVRDRADNLMRCIVEENVAPSALDPEILLACGCDMAAITAEPLKHLTIYTHIFRTGKGRFRSFQELNGAMIPGTDGHYNEAELPWRPLRWVKVTGESYGRSHMEEYISTVKNVEYLTKALVEFARAASRVTPIVKPHATTSVKEINEAKNGQAVYGMADDISFMQMDKFPDFRAAKEVLDSETQALQAVFLMNASVQRQAERVTAEEFSRMAAELEGALGGVHSILSKDMQLPMIAGIMRQMGERGTLPKFPPRLRAHIKPTVLTGTDALGRQADLTRFAQAAKLLTETLGPDILAQVADPRAIVNFVLTNAGVPTSGILKTQEQIEQEQAAAQQQAMQQQALQSGLGPAINAVGKNPGVVQEGAEIAQDQVQQ